MALGISKRTRSVLIFAVKIVVAALLIWWLLRSTGAKKIDWEYLRRTLERWPLLLLAFGLLLLVPFAGALRWFLLLRCQGFEVGFWRALHLTLVGIFFNCIGVGYTGGDVIKAYYVARDQERGRRAEAVYTVGFDRAVGLYGLLLLGCAGVLCSVDKVFTVPRVRNTALGMVAVVAVVTWGFFFMWSRRFRESRSYAPRLERSLLGSLFLRFYRSVKIYRNKWGVLISTVAISIAAHVLMIAVLWSLGTALGMGEITVPEFAFYAAAGMALSAIGPPMGVGFGQFFFTVFFRMHWGEEGEHFGFMLATLQQLVLLVFNTTVGLPAFLSVRRQVAELRATMEADERAAQAAAAEGETAAGAGESESARDE
jgi:uncharacterized protein (TIRG00374 family)